jgi:Spy/CpxP family protein refolding chaperone
MKRTFVLSMLLLLVILFSVDTSAQFRKFKRGNHNMMIEKLNLTAEQKTKVDDLKIIHQKEMIDLKSELAKTRLDLKELKSKTDIKRNEVLNLVEKINGIKNKMSIARVNHRMDIYELLDDNQREIWRDTKPMGPGRNMEFRDNKMMKHKRMGKD